MTAWFRPRASVVVRGMVALWIATVLAKPADWLGSRYLKQIAEKPNWYFYACPLPECTSDPEGWPDPPERHPPCWLHDDPVAKVLIHWPGKPLKG